jgi:hypothetical protein
MAGEMGWEGGCVCSVSLPPPMVGTVEVARRGGGDDLAGLRREGVKLVFFGSYLVVVYKPAPSLARRQVGFGLETPD